MADLPGPRGLALMEWIIAFLIICSIFMLLRLYAAKLIKRTWFADDVFSVIGYAGTVSQGGVTIWAIYLGAGEHQADLPIQDVRLILKVSCGHTDIFLKEVDTDSLQMFAQQIFQLPCAITWLTGTCSVKIAMLCLYTRIFTTRQFRIWAYLLMAAVAIYFVAFLILFMTNCIPLSHLWDPVPWGWCRDLEIEQYTSVTFNLLIDLCIVILPMPSLWNLKMPLRNKFFVSIMFSIGLITIAIMCWRLQATTATLDDPDFTHYFTDIGLISCLELWLGVIVNCMPTLGPLFKTYMKPMFSRVNAYFSKGSSGKGEPPVRLESISNRRRYHHIDSGNNTAYSVTTEITHGDTKKDHYIEGDFMEGGVRVRNDIEIQAGRDSTRESVPR